MSCGTRTEGAAGTCKAVSQNERPTRACGCGTCAHVEVDVETVSFAQRCRYEVYLHVVGLEAGLQTRAVKRSAFQTHGAEWPVVCP